jgi:starvation-inducible DNA-binding protein
MSSTNDNPIQTTDSGIPAHDNTDERRNFMTTSLRRSDNKVRQFDAPPSLPQNLQKVLVDLVELHLQGKQAHWNLVGTNFRDLHLQLDEIVDTAREASDTIAERMRALNAIPDGRSDTVTASTTLPLIPAGELSTTDTVDLVTVRIYAAVETMRTVHDDVDAADPSTADLLHAIIDDLEKAAWMLKAENQKI